MHGRTYSKEVKSTLLLVRSGFFGPLADLEYFYLSKPLGLGRWAFLRQGVVATAFCTPECDRLKAASGSDSDSCQDLLESLVGKNMKK